MVYLISDGIAAGVAGAPEVRTPYTSLAEAKAQAAEDLRTGRTPLRIVDEATGETLWEPPRAT